MVLYLHLGPFAQYVQRELARQVAGLDEESAVIVEKVAIAAV